MNRTPGFTLIELMVTLAVMAIAVTIAVPSYQSLITTNRMAGEMNQFIATLHYARSEAIKRGVAVRVCTSVNGNTCNGANDWTQGWIVRVDDAANMVLKRYPGLSGGDTLIGDGNTGDRVLFNPTGFAFGSNGRVALCDSARDLGIAREAVIANTGRIQLRNNPASCTPGV